MHTFLMVRFLTGAALAVVATVILMRLGQYRRPRPSPLHLTIPWETARHGMRTGDLLLFSGYNHDSCLLRGWLNGGYTHCAMVLNLREGHGLDGFVSEEKQHLYLLHSNVDDDLPDALKEPNAPPTHGVQLNDLDFAVSVYHGLVHWVPLTRPLTSRQRRRLWAFVRTQAGRPFNGHLPDLLRCTDEFGWVVPGAPDSADGVVCSALLLDAYAAAGVLKEGQGRPPSWKSNPGTVLRRLEEAKATDEVVLIKNTPDLN